MEPVIRSPWSSPEGLSIQGRHCGGERLNLRGRLRRARGRRWDSPLRGWSSCCGVEGSYLAARGDHQFDRRGSVPWAGCWLTGGSLACPSGVAPVWLLAHWPSWHVSTWAAIPDLPHWPIGVTCLLSCCTLGSGLPLAYPDPELCLLFVQDHQLHQLGSPVNLTVCPYDPHLGIPRSSRAYHNSCMHTGGSFCG